jgi:hypothetical protein
MKLSGNCNALYCLGVKMNIKKIIHEFTGFIEGKWILKPCVIKTSNPGLKALLNMLLIVPKSLLLFIVIVAVFMFIPSLVLAPIGILIQHYVPWFCDGNTDYFYIGFFMIAFIGAVIGLIFIFYILISFLHVKYKVYKRYYQIYGKNK